MENVIKECQEEANISEDLAKNAKPAGAVSYEYLINNEEGDHHSHWGGAKGLKRDVLFCYDLKVPESFQPSNNDGEVCSNVQYVTATQTSTTLQLTDTNTHTHILSLSLSVSVSLSLSLSPSLSVCLA